MRGGVKRETVRGIMTVSDSNRVGDSDSESVTKRRARVRLSESGAIVRLSESGARVRLSESGVEAARERAAGKWGAQGEVPQGEAADTSSEGLRPEWFRELMPGRLGTQTNVCERDRVRERARTAAPTSILAPMGDGGLGRPLPAARAGNPRHRTRKTPPTARQPFRATRNTDHDVKSTKCFFVFFSLYYPFDKDTTGGKTPETNNKKLPTLPWSSESWPRLPAKEQADNKPAPGKQDRQTQAQRTPEYSRA